MRGDAVVRLLVGLRTGQEVALLVSEELLDRVRLLDVGDVPGPDPFPG